MRIITNTAIFVITVLSILFMGHLIRDTSVRGGTVNMYHEYYVRPGDTLWDIAKEYNDNNKDLRKYIYNIMKQNEMETPDIIPGQMILIPLQ